MQELNDRKDDVKVDAHVVPTRISTRTGRPNVTNDLRFY
jgi:hypothetical protein